MDLTCLVQCLTVVNPVMNMHVPYNAGNSESQAAPERGIWPMAIIFLYSDNGLLQGRGNPGLLNSVSGIQYLWAFSMGLAACHPSGT